MEKIVVIEPGHSKRHYLKDLWSYRDLFYFLAWRDILVRYKQTVIGILWAVLRPLITMLVFTVVFGKMAKFPSNGVPYPILVYIGMLPWQFFSSSLQECSSSLITNNNLVTKIYFPRLIIPLSAVIVAFMDFLISFIILVVIMVYYQFIPGWRILFLPFFIIFTFVAAIGPGLYIAALNIKYRDFRYIIPFLTQFGLYISPVGFNSNIIPEKWLWFYSLNPMVGVIDGFRWCILGETNPIYWPRFTLSLLVTISLFIIGTFYFLNTEKKFADII